MYKKKCRCKATDKSFHNDIGEFFIGDCCIEAGYDNLGKKAGQDDDEDTANAGDTTSAGQGDGQNDLTDASAGNNINTGEVNSDGTPGQGETQGAKGKPDGDLDGDGDVDGDDVQLGIDLEAMGQKALMAECDKKGISYKSNESKASLREMLKA